MNITIFKSIKETSTPFIIPLHKSVKRIRDGKSRKIIEEIRNLPEGEDIQPLKKTLPTIVFSGEFSYRNNSSLIKHSGLMVVDFDHFDDEKVYEEYRSLIEKNPYVISAFRSPSGNGLKAVIRIPECTPEEHTLYFKAFESEFNYDYFDKSTSDVSRACFESYDPEIYYNPDAKVYNPELKEEGHTVSEKIIYTPITDEEEIISKIMDWNWDYDFRKGERNNFTYVLSRTFSEYGVSRETASRFFINHYSSPDFNDREITNAVKSAYRSTPFGIKKFEDHQKKIELIENVKSLPKKDFVEKYDVSFEEYEDIKKEATKDEFWYFDVKKNGEKKIRVDPYKFKLFLESNGFKKTYLNDMDTPTFVKVNSNIVQKTSPEIIKDFVLEHLLKDNNIDVWSYFASYNTLFSEQYLLMLETIELVVLKDLANKSFIAFRNGILEVTKNTIAMIDYIDVDKYIWESHIVDRNFKKTDDCENDYSKFIKNISHKSSTPLESTIGYLLSTHKNKVNNKAVIFNDEEISDDPEGGTGKGLIMQGIKQIRSVSILDGKIFDDSKSFPYQTVSTDTNVLLFDDVKNNWNFESKFSIVTEGITLERKGKDAIKLPVEDSPKIAVTTNYVIKGSGNSHERRKHEIEVSQHYNRNLTPYDDFGRQLFDDWNEDDFIKFDNYMVKCLQLYLREGLIPQLDATNIEIRKFIAETNREFWAWAEDGNLPENTRLYRNGKYEEFTNEYPDYGRGKYQLSQKSFKIYMDKYGRHKGYEVMEGRDHIGRYTEYVTEHLPDKEEMPF